MSRNHATKVEREINAIEIQNDNESAVLIEPCNYSLEDCNNDMVCEETCFESEPNKQLSNESDNDIFLKSIAEFYLKLECIHLIPVSTIQYILTESQTIHILEQNHFKETIKNCLIELPINQINDILNTVFIKDRYLNTTKALDSDFKRKKWYKNNLSYVLPVPALIDEKKRSFFQYIPIRTTFKYFFNDNNVKDMMNLDF